MLPDKLIIYGAGVMARALKMCVESAPYKRQVERFIVNGKYDNPPEIEGVKVYTLEEACDCRDEEIVVALNEENMKSAIQDLRDAGFEHLHLMNAAGDEWAKIKYDYYLHNNEKCYLPFVPLEPDKGPSASEDLSLSLFVVNSIHDKPVGSSWESAYYEKNIQVGAALTDKRIYEICDNTGVNISEKNKKYCELTALYWAWKNQDSDFAGISHYRRRFDLSEGQISFLNKGGADIVLTVPVINTAGIGKQYGISHSEKDWDLAGRVVSDYCPEYSAAFSFVEKQTYFHAYNMFIMRRDILDKYCRWLFDILFKCEELIGDKADPYQNRYPGFLAERLLNVFLYKNKDKYKIFIANKRYLE